ncbi:3-oxoacyl-[acyl-carrier-protein] synthase III C-terminal domain-containing protein [Flavobacterium ginsengisoli]
MSQVSQDALAKNDLEATQIDWVVPHQANLRIINAVGESLNIDSDKVKVNIDRYGNTTSATVPLCLWDFAADFKEGQNVLITTFGAGFSWGATCLKWGVMREKNPVATIKANKKEEGVLVEH